MTRRRVIMSADLGEFFRTELSEAQSSLGLELPDLLEYYLVNLLCDFSRAGEAPMPGDEALALQYKRALEANLVQRIKLLKDLGDVALYVSGFFVEFIERSLVDIDYYISMGGNAYTNLSELVGAQQRGEQFAELYGELGGKFTELVDLLNEVSERTQKKGDKDLLRLYDRWLRTKSQRIRKLLVDEGLVPDEDLPTEYLQ